MKYKTEFNQAMQKELNSKSKKINKTLMIIGAIGLLAYIVIGTILEEEVWWCEALLVFALPFSFGLILLITINKQEKKAVFSNQYNVYEFNDDFLNAETYSKGECTSKVKFYYKDIVRVKETDNYLFLFIQIKHAFPVLKSGFEAGEKEKLIENINKAKQVK